MLPLSEISLTVACHSSTQAMQSLVADAPLLSYSSTFSQQFCRRAAKLRHKTRKHTGRRSRDLPGATKDELQAVKPTQRSKIPGRFIRAIEESRRSQKKRPTRDAFETKE
ncbi:unnamed protein product [Sympodiomycopsis kandeliae]